MKYSSLESSFGHNFIPILFILLTNFKSKHLISDYKVINISYTVGICILIVPQEGFSKFSKVKMEIYYMTFAIIIKSLIQYISLKFSFLKIGFKKNSFSM